MNLIDKDDFNDALTILFEEVKELKRTAKTEKECRRCSDTLAGLVLAKQELEEAPVITHTAEATNEILINEAEFDAAVLKAAEEVKEDCKRASASAFVIIMTGTSFASHMKKFLFGKEEEK